MLRDQGHSFASIAGSVGMKRSADAYAGFVRAVKDLPEEQRSELVGRESARLDELEERIRNRDSSDPPKMERRLDALKAMRDRLL